MEVGKLFQFYITVSFHVPYWPCDRGEEVAYLLLLGSIRNSTDLSVLLPKDARQFATGEGRIPLARSGTRPSGEVAGDLSTVSTRYREGHRRHGPGFAAAPGRLASPRRNPDVLWGAFRLAAAQGPGRPAVPAERRRTKPCRSRRGATAPMPVACFGTPADRPLFEALFADETVIAVHQAPDFRSVAPPGAKPSNPSAMFKARLRRGPLAPAVWREPVRFRIHPGPQPSREDRRASEPGSFPHYRVRIPDRRRQQVRKAAHAKVKAFLDKQSKVEPKKDEPDAAKLVEQLVYAGLR